MSKPTDLTPAAIEFLTERHLATLTTQRRDSSPHVAAVGFTFVPTNHVVRVITSNGSQKAANAKRGGRAAVAQVDGRRWLSLEGECRLLTAQSEVRHAEQLYAQRYRVPRPNPARVVVEIQVDRVLGSGFLLGKPPRKNRK